MSRTEQNRAELTEQNSTEHSTEYSMVQYSTAHSTQHTAHSTQHTAHSTAQHSIEQNRTEHECKNSDVVKHAMK